MGIETEMEGIDQTKLRYWGLMFGRYDTDEIVDIDGVLTHYELKDKDFISTRLVFEGDESYIIKYGRAMRRLKGDKRATVRYLAEQGLDPFTILRISNACLATVKREFDALNMPFPNEAKIKRVVIKYSKEGKELIRLSGATEASKHAGVGFRDMVKILKKAYGKLGKYYYRYKLLELKHA